jgi:hypothetical protein
VFAFDNATSHSVFASDALVAKDMAPKPGGKQAKLRYCIEQQNYQSFSFTFIFCLDISYFNSIVFNIRPTIYGDGIHQSMTFPMDYHDEKLRGEPKGMKIVLQERGLWRDGLKKKCDPACPKEHNDCCALAILRNQPDFLNQKSIIEEIITAAGHKVIYYPKFHCELNFIERFWGATKRFTRANCDYTWNGLQETVPRALQSVSLTEIRNYARKAFRYMDAYRIGLTGKAAEYAVKKYRSHRKLPESAINDLSFQ